MPGTYAIEARRGVGVLTFGAFAGLPLDAVVTTRHGGVSEGAYASLNLGLHVGDRPDAVVENRRRAAATVGLDVDDLVFCDQVHGCEVVAVDAADRGRGARDKADAVAAADAVVTTTRGVGLVVLVADCVPILLVDPIAGVLGCVHAGWRGTVARVAAAAVDRMTEAGAHRAAIVAGLGPAIDVARYQVGDEVATAAARSFGPAAADLLVPDGTGRWRFDLWAANRRVLVEAGVPDRSVSVAACPTGGDGPFYSDREVRPCGRFALIAALR